MHDLRLRGLEHAERADVGRALGEHHVARVEEEPGDQVEGLLAADGDDDVVRRGAAAASMPESAITSQIRSRSSRVPWPMPYCRVVGAVLGGEPAEHLADRVERQRGDVRGAAGERDDLGTAGDGEQCSDLRGGHAAHPPGVPVGVVVERRAGHATSPRARRLVDRSSHQ